MLDSNYVPCTYNNKRIRDTWIDGTLWIPDLCMVRLIICMHMMMIWRLEDWHNIMNLLAWEATFMFHSPLSKARLCQRESALVVTQLRLLGNGKFTCKSNTKTTPQWGSHKLTHVTWSHQTLHYPYHHTVRPLTKDSKTETLKPKAVQTTVIDWHQIPRQRVERLRLLLSLRLSHHGINNLEVVALSQAEACPVSLTCIPCNII